jgi:[ribosomal protein S5]-alanine N-acetyltransferase
MSTVPVRLEAPSAARAADFLAAVRRSRKLHARWVAPPDTPRAFADYLERLTRPTHLGFFVCTQSGAIAGVVNVNEIVRGGFESAYLGYYAFEPHQGLGFMRHGLKLVIDRAFGRHRLHRLEANVQPKNHASRALVERLGFRLEGFSPRYLKIAGRFRDHERWAVTREDWRKLRRNR